MKLYVIIFDILGVFIIIKYIVNLIIGINLCVYGLVVGIIVWNYSCFFMFCIKFILSSVIYWEYYKFRNFLDFDIFICVMVL